MVKFAPVAPPRIIDKLSPIAKGDYHLLLAHDVAEHPSSYANTFPNSTPWTIIMDNSVIELNNAVDLSLVKRAAEAVRCYSIVLPDVLEDGKATAERSTSVFNEWRECFEALYGKSHPWGFMYVPQGKTIQEWAASAQAMQYYPNINFWGIPRNLVKNVGTRREAIKIAYALNPERKIHLLGFSDNLVDDVICARYSEVVGIDSAVPLRAGSYGIDLNFNMQIQPRGDWWDTAEWNGKMDENIDTFKQWIRP